MRVKVRGHRLQAVVKGLGVVYSAPVRNYTGVGLRDSTAIMAAFLRDASQWRKRSTQT